MIALGVHAKDRQAFPTNLNIFCASTAGISLLELCESADQYPIITKYVTAPWY